MNLITQIMCLVGTFSLICSSVVINPEECSTLNTLAHLARRGLECNNNGTDCICKALGVIEDADDYTNGMENINILEGNLTYVSELELVRQTYSSIRIQWNFTYPEHIPVVYLIERNSEFYKEWIPLMTVKRNIAVLRDLASGTRYRVRVRAITSKGQIGKPVISREFKTLPDTRTKQTESSILYTFLIFVSAIALYTIYEECTSNEIEERRRQPYNTSNDMMEYTYTNGTRTFLPRESFRTVIGQISGELELGVVHTRSLEN